MLEELRNRALWYVEHLRSNGELPYLIFGCGQFTNKLLAALRQHELPLPELILDDKPSLEEIDQIPVKLPGDVTSLDRFKAIILGSDVYDKKLAARISKEWDSYPPIVNFNSYLTNIDTNIAQNKQPATLKEVSLSEACQASAQMNRQKQSGMKVIMFNMCTDQQLQFIEPILSEIQRRKLQAACWLSCDQAIPSSVLESSPFKDIPFVSSEVATYLENTDVFLETEIYGRGPKSASKIFVGHGQPNKITNWAYENLKSFDHYFLYGQLEREMFDLVTSKTPESASHIEFHQIGYPKLDGQFNGDYDRAQIFRALTLDPDLKTVMYAPAFDPGCSLREHGLEIVKLLLSDPSINVLVKLHPASMVSKDNPHWEFYTGGVEWRDAFRPLETNSRFAFISDQVANPYFFITDVLITDFSGVALEYMSLDRPVIYIHCPEFYEKTLPEWNCNADLALHDDRLNAGRNAGEVVFDLKKLAETVKSAISHPERHADKRKQLMDRFLYNPGKGSAATVDAILEILSQRDADGN